MLDGACGGLVLMTPITGAIFEELDMDLFMKSTDPVENCLREAKMEISGGVMNVLILRNTMIPIKKERGFSATVGMQRFALIWQRMQALFFYWI